MRTQALPRRAGGRAAAHDPEPFVMVGGRRVILGYSALPGGGRWVPAISVDPDGPNQRRRFYVASAEHAVTSPVTAMQIAGRMAADWPKLDGRDLVATLHWLGITAACA